MKWTKGEEKKLKKLKENKVPIEDIVKILNRSYWSITNKSSQINSSRQYKPWSKEEFELAKIMHNDGYTYGQIGNELGRTTRSIQGKFQEHRKSICPNCGHELNIRGQCMNCGYCGT